MSGRPLRIRRMPSNAEVECLRDHFDHSTRESALIERILVAWQRVADRNSRLKAWREADRIVAEDDR